MDREKINYKELGRYNSWGTAKTFQKSLEKNYNMEGVKIFKDLTDAPFVAYKETPYVVVKEEKSE